jgi:hypothetical protein
MVYMTIGDLDENEDKMCIHINNVQLMMFNIRWKFNCCVMNNVVHMWLINKCYLMQLELQLYIIGANVHVLMVS